MKFRERWIGFLYRAATGARKTRTLLTPVGIAIFGAFTAGFVLAALAVDRLLDLPSLLPVDRRLLISIPIAALGVGVTAWSALHFLKVKGTPVPFNPPPRLVATGPYRYARNPMLSTAKSAIKDVKRVNIIIFLLREPSPSCKKILYHEINFVPVSIPAH